MPEMMGGEMTSRRNPSSRPSPPPSRPNPRPGRTPRTPADAAESVSGKSSMSRPRRRGRAAGATPLAAAERPTATRSVAPSPKAPRPHVPVAIGWGAIAAFVSALFVSVPVFIGWVFDSKSSVSWNSTLGVAIDLWALAHRGHVHSADTNVVFSPLLLTLLCVLVARFGARAALPKQRLAGRDVRVILGAFVIGYIVGAELLALIASLGSSSVNPLTLIFGPALVAALGVAWATWRERQNSPELAAFDSLVLDATPLLVRRSVRAGLRGLSLFAGMMFLFLIVLVAWHGQQVWSVHRQLHAGIGGGILLVLGQLAALPNILALLAGWCVGAPVHVGDVIVAHSGMASGTLPMVPVFAAIPQGGVRAWSWCLIAAPLVVGAFIGWDASGSLTRLSSLRAKAVVGACAATLAFVVLWVLWWFSTVSISTGLLHYVGPGWTAWVYVPVEFLVPAVAAAAVRHWIINHRHP